MVFSGRSAFERAAGNADLPASLTNSLPHRKAVPELRRDGGNKETEGIRVSMKKPAITDTPILDQLRDRWSPRAFSSRPVSPESLRSLIEAARWAPSCFNVQPWRFIVATRDRDVEFRTALSCLFEGNQKWAQHAPLLLLVAAQMNFDDGKENPHAFYDTGQAMAHLSVQATALGLFIHQMAGIVHDKIHRTYGLPDGFEAVCAAAIGYYGETDSLDGKLRDMEVAPRARRAISETFFSAAWDRPAQG